MPWGHDPLSDEGFVGAEGDRLLGGHGPLNAGGAEPQVAVGVHATEAAHGDDVEDATAVREHQEAAVDAEERLRHGSGALAGGVKRRQGAQLKGDGPGIGAALAQLVHLGVGTLDGNGGDDQTDGHDGYQLRQREVQQEVVDGQAGEEAGIDTHLGESLHPANVLEVVSDGDGGIAGGCTARQKVARPPLQACVRAHSCIGIAQTG